jgi:phosphoglycolate phosphatase
VTKPAVLFDLDGTLSDSAPGIWGSARYAFDRLSAARGQLFPLPSDAELRWMIGPPLRDSFARLAGPEHVEALLGFYLERYSDVGAFENNVYQGVPETLDTLAGTGARLFVATSKNQHSAERILAHFGLASRFVAIHGARNDGSLADKTELIADLIVKHALAPDETGVAMIGDRKFDMIGARNNGLRAIGALWGYGDREELEAAGAHATAERPADVTKLLAGS